MKKTCLKLNRFLAANFIAALVGFPLVLANVPVLAAEKSSQSDYNFLAVNAVLNPDGQKDNELLYGHFAADNIAFVQSSYIYRSNYIGQNYGNEPAVANVKKNVVVTAYSSTPDQTDDSPFITANGEHVYDGGIACNFLPFGTKVRLPDYSGDKVYTVNDRMAKRFSYKMDIWMETRELALHFGAQKLTVEILK